MVIILIFTLTLGKIKTARREIKTVQIGPTVFLVGGQVEDDETKVMTVLMTENCKLVKNTKYFGCTLQTPTVKDWSFYPILFTIPKEMCL